MADDDPTCCSLAELADPAFFKALSHENRIRLLTELCDCCDSMSVGELADCCDVDMSVVSRHLSKLREAGVVESTRDQQQVRYSIRAEEVVSLLRTMADAIESATETNEEENDE